MDVLKVKVNGQWVGIPSIQGERGPQGETGPSGQDGQDGAPGADGQDGTSAYVYIRYAANQPTADSDMKTTPDAWIGFYSGTASSAPTHYTDYTWYKIKGETGAAGVVQDIQVNGSSILNNGVANLPVADGSTLGVVKVGSGLTIGTDNKIKTAAASETYIKGGDEANRPIVPYNQHQSVFYALAKLAGVDLANATVTVGQWPSNALVAIQKMLGIYEAPWELIKEVTTTEDQTEIMIETDSYGESFKLSELIAVFSCGASTTGTRDSFYGRFGIRQHGAVSDGATSFPSLTYPTATSAMGAKLHIKTYENAPVEVISVAAVDPGNTQGLYAMPKDIIVDYITYVRLYQSASNKSLIPSGANMKLYGRRIVE